MFTVACFRRIVDPLTRRLFPTLLYEADLEPRLVQDLARSIRAFAVDDSAGRRWSREHRYPGYTSYASLNDLPKRDPAFADLARLLTRHARTFASELAWDVRPRLDSLWVNLMKVGGHHSAHIHPHSILSGTLYVEAPPAPGAIRFEDPRLPLMMAAPVRGERAPEELRPFVTVEPRAGMILMWESWLRHEVLSGTGRGERLSISFNFA
ncbi:MAG TPA: TIGR02466 family protein [Sphingomicrobium sp.]|nr:TIGR02466 family protein [Sphingomicrobium sp.]